MKKLQVLLSSYNGEKYIKEQLDSILSQSWENIEILVRDDGSTDGTAEILKEYEKDNKIKLELGENIGFVNSFLWLVKNSGDADYYAYSDQDDVWFSNKIQMAIDKIESECSEEYNMNFPILYFSNYDFYDENLNYISHAYKLDGSKNPTFRNCLVDCLALGFNSVFNKVTKQIISKNIPKQACGHDWWTYMICQGMGKVIYDNRPTVKYRRTGNNVSAGGASFIRFQIWRIKRFLIEDHFSKIRMMIEEYSHLYNDRLTIEDKKVLSLFTKNRYNLIIALRKCFYPKMFRQNFVDEIMIRFFFLIGKL